MPVLTGTFSSVGDSLTIQLNPIGVVQTFNGYTDTTTGVTGTRLFTKEYRYSVDGGYTWTSWNTLTNLALQAIIANQYSLYYFEIRYVRTGADTTGTLTWDFFTLAVTLNLSAVTTLYPAVFTQNNIFGDIETNNQTFVELCGNLHDKIMKYGIVPEYIERTESFEYYWKVICCFFSLHYVLAERLANIYNDRELLRRFLSERNVFLCGDEDLAELQVIANKFYENFRHRGTPEAVTEIMRMVCNCDCCEFIFAYVRMFEGGWTVDKSSPIYRGTRGVRDMNKLPIAERTQVTSLVNYLTQQGMGDPALTIVADVDNNGDAIQVIFIDSQNSDAGIGAYGVPSDLMMTAKVDFPIQTDGWSMNYEISFLIKQAVLGDMISFGVKCMDCDGVEIPNATVDMETGLDSDWFFEKKAMLNNTDYFQFAGIVFNENEPLRSATDATLSAGIGKHLRFKSGLGIKKIYPTILIQDGNLYPNNDHKIYKVRVALASNPYALSLVDTANMIISYFSNGNQQLTQQQLEDRIRKYMIPLNSNLLNTLIP